MDEDSDGVLSREEFSNMLSGVGIYLTAHEQELMKERWVLNTIMPRLLFFTSVDAVHALPIFGAL